MHTHIRIPTHIHIHTLVQIMLHLLLHIYTHTSTHRNIDIFILYAFFHSSSNTTIDVTFFYPITTTYHTSINTHQPCTSSQYFSTDIEVCVVACSAKEEEDRESASASELGSEGRSSGSGTSYDSMIIEGINKRNALKNEKEKEKEIRKGIEVESEDDDTADRDGDYDGDKGTGKGKGKGGEGVVDENCSKMNNHQSGWDGGMRRNGSSSFSFSAAKVKSMILT